VARKALASPSSGELPRQDRLSCTILNRFGAIIAEIIVGVNPLLSENVSASAMKSSSQKSRARFLLLSAHRSSVCEVSPPSNARTPACAKGLLSSVSSRNQIFSRAMTVCASQLFCSNPRIPRSTRHDRASPTCHSFGLTTNSLLTRSLPCTLRLKDSKMEGTVCTCPLQLHDSICSLSSSNVSPNIEHDPLSRRGAAPAESRPPASRYLSDERTMAEAGLCEYMRLVD
jgi:hypothetical protein